MMLRRILDAVRFSRFKRRRKKIARDAVSRQDGILASLGSGLVVPEVQEFSARGANGDYSIFVMLPVAPPPEGGYPVIYLLDGNAWIGGAAETLRLQARFATEARIEPVMIVAVGYPGGQPIDMGRRAYDFLPKHTSTKLGDRFMQGMPWHQPGGIHGFIEFLTGPLRRDIAARYPVNPDRQILCGHSFGGLFALYTLLLRPKSFNRYAALSPSLWWDDGSLLKQTDELARKLPPDMKADIFIAVGDDETPSMPHISERMAADAAEMAGKLRAFPGLTVDHRLLAGETHLSVPLTIFSAMLRFATTGHGFGGSQR